MNWILFAVAGAAGSVARYGLSSLLGQWLGSAFPWGIFITNVLGCFLFGLFWAAIAIFHVWSDATRVIILTGFMGAFTTFSTFIFDSQSLLEGGHWLALALNIGGQIVLGILALQAGIRTVHLMLG
ncbi:MAG: CrcB family protein [Desulfovibrionaceae bacterium]|nr:CrcB family protein [Desulfovibrionaceae bacterium]